MSKRKIEIAGEKVFLTEKEQLFADHYIITNNATESALKAGYSKNCAGQQGYENLKKPEIKKYLKLKSKPILEQLNITQERVLREIAAIAFSDISDYLNCDWSLKNLAEMDKSKTRALKHIDRNDKGFKIQLYDKLAALKILHELVIPAEVPGTKPKGLFESITDYYNSN